MLSTKSITIIKNTLILAVLIQIIIILSSSDLKPVKTEVYAGRFEQADATKYNLLGLPENRLWMSQSEWKGKHIDNTLVKIRFKVWKKFHIKEWTEHMLLEAVKESKVFPDIPPSLYVAQMILESNYGLSKLANVGNNLYGHKYRGQKLGYLVMADDSENDKFQKFKSQWYSMRSHSYLLMGMYRKRIKGKPNLNKWLVALCGSMSAQESKKFVKAGNRVYATSCMTETCYAQKLNNIIKRNNLDRYDTK